MARLPRFNIAGYTQHVFIRGNNKQVVFNEDKDYELYSEKLNEACQRFNCELHAFVLLDNQVHILLTPADEKGISKVMQTLGRYYVQYFNFKYDRSGTLWEGRYRATLVDTDTHMLAVQKFIEQSPLRLEKTHELASYLWSSYQQNAFSKGGVSVTPHKSLFYLFKDPVLYQDEMKQLLSNEMADKLERACFKGWIFGSDEFIASVENASGRRASPLPKGGDRRSEKYKASVAAQEKGIEQPVDEVNTQVDVPNEQPVEAPLLTIQEKVVEEMKSEVVSQQQEPKAAPKKKPKKKKEALVQQSFDDMTQQSLF